MLHLLIPRKNRAVLAQGKQPGKQIMASMMTQSLPLDRKAAAKMAKSHRIAREAALRHANVLHAA
jgi:hypothetical protein